MKILNIVIKVSKLCNLRCKYCYEFPFLANKEKIEEDSLESLFKNLFDSQFIHSEEDYQFFFIWHGGEPLLMKTTYFEHAFRIQETLSPKNIIIHNSIQTNLVSLKKEHINLIKTYNISLGVSIDLYGKLRVNTKGKDIQDIVLKNMDVLIKHDIDFACIVVLSKGNIGKENEIFEFFNKTKTSFRILPIFDSIIDGQNDDFSLQHELILESLKKTHALSYQKAKIVIEPFNEYEKIIDHYLEGTEKKYYNRSEWFSVLLINTDGECYGYDTSYGNEKESYGNIFNHPISEIIKSDNFIKSVERSETIMAYNCIPCEYFGSCSGYPVIETKIDNNYKKEGTASCKLTKDLLIHIENKKQATTTYIKNSK